MSSKIVGLIHDSGDMICVVYDIFILSTSPENGCIVALTNCAALDTGFNKMKNNVLRFLSKTYDRKNAADNPRSLYSEFAVPAARALWTVCLNKPPVLEQLTDPKGQVSTFVKKMLRLLVFVVQNTMGGAVKSELGVEIVFGVCFPLLRTTKTEEKMLASEPGEFVELTKDTTEKQECWGTRTGAAKLLEIICDNNESIMTRVLRVVISGIYKATGEKPGEQTRMWEEEDSLRGFRENSGILEVLDVCLTVAAGMSYAVSSNEKAKYGLE